MSKNKKNTSDFSNEKKLGVYMFLQQFPQKAGVDALLKMKYSNCVKTVSEWELCVNELLEKKIKS